jgi:hypothetical protein
MFTALRRQGFRVISESQVGRPEIVYYGGEVSIATSIAEM